VATALTAGTGVAVLVTAATAMAHDRTTPRDFGATSAPPGRAVVPTPHRADRDAAVRHLPGSKRPASRRQVTPEVPVALSIPALQTRATIVPVTTSDGELRVPDDPMQLGWWTASARVGASRGTVVIDGHIDSATTGPGALFRIAELRTDDLIVVSTASGHRRQYTVTGRRVYIKSDGLPASLFATTGAPRLAVITCGGPFDRATGSYLDNIVVFAVPAAAQ
jgi:hypothetical protein